MQSRELGFRRDDFKLVTTESQSAVALSNTKTMVLKGRNLSLKPEERIPGN